MKGEKKYEEKHLNKNDNQQTPPEWLVKLITDLVVALTSSLAAVFLEHWLNQPK